jgi:hypothetical protein
MYLSAIFYVCMYLNVHMYVYIHTYICMYLDWPSQHKIILKRMSPLLLAMLINLWNRKAVEWTFASKKWKCFQYLILYGMKYFSWLSSEHITMQRAILNFNPGPQGWNLSPRGNARPVIQPQGWTLSTRYLEEWRENYTPRGQSLPLGAKLRMGLCCY